jgi:hypothetical protein
MTNNLSLLENVLVNGDLKTLQPNHRVEYYKMVCESNKLNPYTKPFDYISLQGKVTLYANKDCAAQLRRIHDISIRITSRDIVDGIYTVTACASTKDGRMDESIGAININGLKGEQLANAYMKGETKAKRRVTLSIAGLGFVDESELESIKGAKRVNVNFETGEIIEGETISEEKPKFKQIESTSPSEKKIELITNDQATDLIDLLVKNETDITEQRIKEKYGINTLLELTVEQLNNTMDIYNKKIERINSKKNKEVKNDNPTKGERAC